MKTMILNLLLLLSLSLYSQEDTRIQSVRNQLEALSVDNASLGETLKLEVNISHVRLSDFLIGISKMHGINMNVDPALNEISVVNNFSEVTVADLLVFLCKTYALHIDFTGNILSVYPYEAPVTKTPEKEIAVAYDPIQHQIDLDLKDDPLEKVFRKITDVSGRNLLFASGMENKMLHVYLKAMDFDAAMEHLARANHLTFRKSRDGLYVFDQEDVAVSTAIKAKRTSRPKTRHRMARQEHFFYKVIDTMAMTLEVDFDQAPIHEIIDEMARDLGLDVYTATSLERAGTLTLHAKQIHFDALLVKMFESRQYIGEKVQEQTGKPNEAQDMAAAFSFKKEGRMYFFGTEDQLSVRGIEVIPLMHRAIELLGDPASAYGRMAGRTAPRRMNYMNAVPNNPTAFSNANTNRTSVNTRSGSFNRHGNKAEALVNILPDEIKAMLDIKIDFELNSFIVSGPATHIERFKQFIKEIDKPVPVILIEVMLIEVNRTATVETGISWGIAEPTTTKGSLFPSTDLTLGAKTVNKVIGGFNGFGSFNIGKVIPEFFAGIKAMEANGNIKIRSTPKLSTLNGHRASLSIGETTYYVVTNQSFYGSQIPQSSEIRNYQPIDAELAVNIKPLVSGDGQITLDISVIQSDFNGERIDEDAPPGINSREFSSIIRMRDQDLAILGGLEEKVKNDAGSGVPLLARIPVIKWLFSKRKRENSKRKLTILIKPTIIY